MNGVPPDLPVPTPSFPTRRSSALPHRAATRLARVIAVLQKIDPAGGPSPGPHNSFRGVPLASRDAETRAAISGLDGLLDTGLLTAAWEEALEAPAWGGPEVWLHGDLHPGNLLVQRGRLGAVIDFGCLGLGDPACELRVAWTLLSAEIRDRKSTRLNSSH